MDHNFFKSRGNSIMILLLFLLVNISAFGQEKPKKAAEGTQKQKGTPANEKPVEKQTETQQVEKKLITPDGKAFLLVDPESIDKSNSKANEPK